MSIIEPIARLYNFLFVEICDPRTVNYPLLQSPIYLATMVISYLLMTKYGPKLMANRAPFQVDRLVLIYNIFQIILTSYLFIAAVRACYIPLRYSLICEPVSTSTSPEEMHIISLAYLYFLIKIYDLLDTVFIILRKKSSQLSVLHIYHHTGMIIVSWVGVRYVPGGQSVFLGTVNSFVHAVMYSYYLLTIIDPSLRSSWWKKYITQLQFVQFIAVFFNFTAAVLTPSCNYPKYPLLIMLPSLWLLIMLFVKFYKAEYGEGKRKIR